MNDILQKAIADRDARPWRYYRFEWDDAQRWLEKLADERDRLRQMAPPPDMTALVAKWRDFMNWPDPRFDNYMDAGKDGHTITYDMERDAAKAAFKRAANELEAWATAQREER